MIILSLTLHCLYVVEMPLFSMDELPVHSSSFVHHYVPLLVFSGVRGLVSMPRRRWSDIRESTIQPSQTFFLFADVLLSLTSSYLACHTLSRWARCCFVCSSYSSLSFFCWWLISFELSGLFQGLCSGTRFLCITAGYQFKSVLGDWITMRPESDIGVEVPPLCGKSRPHLGILSLVRYKNSGCSVDWFRTGPRTTTSRILNGAYEGVPSWSISFFFFFIMLPIISNQLLIISHRYLLAFPQQELWPYSWSEPHFSLSISYQASRIRARFAALSP